MWLQKKLVQLAFYPLLFLMLLLDLGSKMLDPRSRTDKYQDLRSGKKYWIRYTGIMVCTM
jgi:hypothetical protein